MPPTSSMPDPDFVQARRNMVDGQLRTFEVTDRALLAAMNEVPRERFMRDGERALSYSDRAVDLPVREGGPRCMLPPMVLARMLQALDIAPGMRVLDVGSGFGYTAALLARLGARVTALEPDAELAGAARPRFAAEEFGDRIVQREGPLATGCPEDAPFDAIVVNGAVGIEPASLLAQLSPAGRLACLRSDAGRCRAVLYVRAGEGYGSRPLFDAAASTLDAFGAPQSFRF